MLRPTESPTLFLQQLGRGLRKTRNKGALQRARLRRHPPPRVPLRPSLPGAARRHPARRRAGRQGAVPVPAGRLPHGARPRRRRRRAAQHPQRHPQPVARQGRRAPLAPPGPTRHRPGRLPRRDRPRPRRRLHRQPWLVRPPRRRRRAGTRGRTRGDLATSGDRAAACTSTTANASMAGARCSQQTRLRRLRRCPSGTNGCCTCWSPRRPTR